MNIESKRLRVIEALKAAAARTPVPAPVHSQSSVESSGQDSRSEPIAIIGLSGFFPNSMSVKEFWKALDEDRSLIQEVPPSRFDWRSLSVFSGEEAGSRVRWGGFIPEIRGFDASFFGILPAEAQVLDPRRRLLLMSVYHTLEDAGYAPASLRNSRTGVYIAAEERVSPDTH